MFKNTDLAESMRTKYNEDYIIEKFCMSRYEYENRMNNSERSEMEENYERCSYNGKK